MIYVAIIVILAVTDLGIKWYIEQQGPEGFPKPTKWLKGNIWLYRNHNAGFPFGFMERYGRVVRTVPLVIISFLSGVFCYLLSKNGRRVQKLGLAILLGGAISNLYDRLVRRYVVDYFSIRFGCLKKVVLNLGDIFVFTGAGILAVIQLTQEMKDFAKKLFSGKGDSLKNS